MNRFCWTLIFLCFFYISLSQENYNLKININDSQSVILDSFSTLDSSSLRINQDTILNVSCVKNNLFYIEHNSKKYYLFLTKDTKLDVIVNLNDVVFQGEHTSFIYFLNDYFNFHQVSFKPILDSFSLYQTIDEFEILLYDFINNELFYFFQNHIRFQDLTDQSKAYFQTLIKYEYLNSLSTFLFEKSILDSKGFISSLNDVNIDLLEFATFEKSFNDTSYHDMAIFQNYIFNTLFLTLASKYNKKLQDFDDFQMFSIHFFNYMINHIPSHFFTYCVQKYVEKFAVFLQKNTINHLLLLMKEQKFDKNDIININNILDSNYIPNQETIVVDDVGIQNDFYIEDVDGKQVSLNMFKGKVLYIDIWASWCGPCRKQFPYSKDLKSRFSKKQLKKLKFIYISIDNDYSKWRESMLKLNLKGNHFISPASQSNSAGTYFGVSSIPRYIIIDKTGEIIENNAKRPSDNGIFFDLVKLLN
ncbi:MAG: hypothetical protein CMP56_00110 [Flavobacteriales bacterium]|nr:hypothetical protein [Flavobacteriales bacterium]